MGKDCNINIRTRLEELYKRYHKPEWIGSDPLKFIYQFQSNADREIVGLIASSLAYGNVKYIHASVARVLERMEGNPYQFLSGSSSKVIGMSSKGFRHRWTDGKDLADLLVGIKMVIEKNGSLGRAFATVDEPGQDIMITLRNWVKLLKAGRECKLLSDPGRSSACKRLHLYLRWMVRSDRLDPGCWEGVSPARLLIPLDTHMHRFAMLYGLTSRKSADIKTVREVTGAFREIVPEDPAKYDFALTRPGIVYGLSPAENI